jgi:hypothetical protein
MDEFFPAPVPVNDTADLVAVAALDDFPALVGEDTRRDVFPDRDDHAARELHRRLIDRDRYRQWLETARTLARAGVRPAPSHHNGQVSVWGAFWDHHELTAQLASSDTRFRAGELMLVLGTIVDAENPVVPYLPPGYDFYAIGVQTAGMACHHRYIVGMPLPMSADGFRSASTLARFSDRNGHSCIGIGGRSLSELVEYHALLTALDLSAETCYDELEEAFYPLDLQHALKLTQATVPSDEELQRPRDTNESMWSWLSGSFAASSWTLYVLGDNCD